MALVMLPCDLPWWSMVQKHLKKLSTTRNTLELIEGMQKIHDMCNVSLEPDEDSPDPNQFTGLLNFLDNDLTIAERSNFLGNTLPNLTNRASNLRMHKPKRGLHFSLQQQPDSTELEYDLMASLMANAFFSTFPKRTDKTHPTLQNFNFSEFFHYLNTNWQKAKLRSFLYYFDWLESEDGENSKGNLKVMRQVMSSREWLTIEDWLECSLPLCPLQIKHEGRLERSPADCLQVSFATTKIGGEVLEGGNSQECIGMFTQPELLGLLLNVELLEDNEVLTVERVRRVTRINDPKNKANLEKLDEPEEITICCVDAEDYSKLPLSQYEEDNVLRELNKCLLAYQQKQSLNLEATPLPPRSRRLSPIGESVSLGSNQENAPVNIPLIKEESCSTTRSVDSGKLDDFSNNNKLKVQNLYERYPQRTTNEATLNNRRGRFIVLGSSGECLPVKRTPLEKGESLYSSCESSDEEFHSAKTSVDDGSEEDDFNKRYSLDLETPERRHTFAERLKDALRREANSMSVSSESSYAVGINVAGSGLSDADIKVKRGGSTGFMLGEDSLDENFLKDSLTRERQWVDKFKNKQTGMSRKESNRSSEYSFSTDYSSELEEVYEQFSRWLEDPILETDKGTRRTLDARDLAVVQFAGSILKRTLSESFAGVPMMEGETPVTASNSADKKKMVLNAKSLSLELARHKHRLAAQLNERVQSEVEDQEQPVVQSVVVRIATCVSKVVQTLEDICVSFTLKTNELSQIAQKPKDGLRAVSTGNWGCGRSKRGDAQLKVIIQWLAASVAGVPALVYYTHGHSDLATLDTIYRLLRDRRWTVKDLTEATLRYSGHVIDGRHEDGGTLFEELIGVERTT